MITGHPGQVHGGADEVLPIEATAVGDHKHPEAREARTREIGER